jgi:hypothetical protein
MGSSKIACTFTGSIVVVGGLGWVDWTPWQFWSMCPISDSVEIEMWRCVCCDDNPPNPLRYPLSIDLMSVDLTG